MVTEKFSLFVEDKIYTNMVLPTNKFITVDFPTTVLYEGETYYFDNKTGYRKSDNCPGACYRFVNNRFDKRLWLYADGKIEED